MKNYLFRMPETIDPSSLIQVTAGSFWHGALWPHREDSRSYLFPCIVFPSLFRASFLQAHVHAFNGNAEPDTSARGFPATYTPITLVHKLL